MWDQPESSLWYKIRQQRLAPKDIMEAIDEAHARQAEPIDTEFTLEDRELLKEMGACL